MRLSVRWPQRKADVPPDGALRARPRRSPKSLRAFLFHILEGDGARDWTNVAFDTFMVVLIVANVVAFAAETVPALEAHYHAEFAAFDGVSIAIFTLEYLARLWVCTDHLPLRRYPPWRARAMFASRPSMLVDLIVILPYYLHAILPLDLRILRILRLLRLLKLARFSPAIDLLGRVLWAERRALFGALILMLGLVLVAATLMYAVEGHIQPDKFGTVPKAMWWAIVTLATVGYGDVVPVTPLGKVLAGVVMIFGLGMFALPISILATGFVAESHRRDFVVTWGMVARVPLFASFDAQDIGEIVTLLRAEIVPAGTVIVRAGEEATAMYFITAGEVLVEVAPEPVHLRAGDFFGEVALVRDAHRSANVMALERCELLVVEVDDFRRLMRRKPELRRHVQAALSQGLGQEWRRAGDIAPEEIGADAPNGPRAT